MNLSEKLKHLRKVEGELRGLNRPMTQMEVVTSMRDLSLTIRERQARTSDSFKPRFARPFFQSTSRIPGKRPS